MKRNLNYQTVNYNGQDVVLVYIVDGKYIPATMTDPEELPEVEILEVEYKGVDIKPILTDCDLEELYQLLNDCEI